MLPFVLMLAVLAVCPAARTEAGNRPLFSEFRNLLHRHSDTLMDHEQDTALLKAVLQEDSLAVSQQLHGDINDRPEIAIGWSFLHIAIINRSAEVATALLSAGADPAHEDGWVGSPIYYLALIGDRQLFQAVTEALLSQGRMSPKLVDDMVSAAARMGHRWMLETIKDTISPDYDLAAYRDVFGRSLLHLASSDGRDNQDDTILYLLKAGLDPWQPDNEGIMPWQVMDRKNDEAAKALMLSFDPNPFQRLPLLDWKGPLWSLLWATRFCLGYRRYSVCCFALSTRVLT